MKITGYINLYRSGWFHREGKPGAFDLHAGDVYPTLESAQREIEPRTHYLATVPVCWPSDQAVAPNPTTSVPVPLAVSRAAFLASRSRGLGKDAPETGYRNPGVRS